MPRATSKNTRVGVNVTVTGDAEVDRKFAETFIFEARKLVRKASRAGAKELLKEAKARVPVRTGVLKKALKVRALKRSRFNKISPGARVIAGSPARGPAYYAHMVEFGTVRMRARPFLRPAMEETKAAVKAAFRDTLKELLK